MGFAAGDDDVAPISQTVVKASTSTAITASASNPNPSTYGQSLSFTATIPRR